MIGKTVSHYRILRKVGEGGMGAVYLAEDVRLKRTVALKVLPEDLAADDTRRRRFTLEARSASALKHPNVAHIYDVGDADGVSYIVMEHIEGVTLSDRIAQGGLPVEEAVSIGIQIADALADAHTRQIVHRDIKPGNVMITGRGQVKVLDFGLARLGHDPDLASDSLAKTTAFEPGAASEMTKAGEILGTVPYMSPEQTLGTGVDVRSDVFSLGVVLYEMLAGERPFAGRTPRETVERIRGHAAQPVDALNGSVSRSLSRIVHRCLEKNPEQRFRNAGEVLAALRALPGKPANHSHQVVRQEQAPQDELSRIESVAVMPFENGSRDEDEEYLCDGLAENLIATLARIPELRVISRHATFVLRDEPRDIPALGERLGVDALVLGDLRPRKDRLVVNVELVGVPDGRRLWGERYDRSLAETGAMERDVAENLARQLKDALSSDEVARLVDQEIDPQAYLLYLKGRSLLIGSATQMVKGAEYLEGAAERDPNYALPHAALAESYMLQGFHNILDQQEARRRARAAARTAVRLDPDLPEAQTALGMMRAFDWDWEGADEAHRRAVEAGPGRDVPHLEYADFLGTMNRLPEALEMAERARRLDPVSPNPTHVVAYICMLMGDYDRAVREFNAAINLHPDWIWGHIKLANTYSRQGRHEEALTEIKVAEAALHGGGTPLARSWVARVYGAAGDREKALEIKGRIQDTEDVRVDPLVLAYIHSALGERERVLDCIEEGYRERSALSSRLLEFPRLEPHLDLDNEPRYRTVLERMDLSGHVGGGTA
jgi:serine/threonine protein kinase/tetratricopeptide (TPR) repeat protein